MIAPAVWTSLEREHGFVPLRIEGRLPASLRGTLYRNGPGQFGSFGRRYTHPFEADGAVTAVRIADGQATGASRIHRTKGLVAERAAGKQLFGRALPWAQRFRNSVRGEMKNTANTNIVSWQGRLFALVEAAKPTEIDPRDVTTMGETDLDGVLVSPFSAHPHRVESRAASYNFGVAYGRHTKLHMYELPDVGPARHLGAIDLPGPPMLHDFIATDSHLIFFVPPVRVDVPRMLLALGSFDRLFNWKPELGTEVIVVSIDRPHEVVRFTIPAFYQWHFANAFTRDGELVVDYVRYPNFDTFYEFGVVAAGMRQDVSDGTLHRARIDLAKQTLRSEPFIERSCEFPTLGPGDHGREPSVTYLVFDRFQAVGSVDARGVIRAHVLESGELVTEPVSVGDHVLALCHSQDAAYVAVYDAARIPDGPVAKIWIEHHVPITFHGTFVTG